MIDFSGLKTEAVNNNTANIDKMSSLEIVKCINDEDKTVAFAVEKALREIAAGVDILADALYDGGRIFYVGAGTSGRLGVLDASECPPTYGVSSEVVQGVLAGGRAAAFDSVEDAEDDFESIAKQLREKGFCSKDVLVAISASGSANCVMGAIDLAKKAGSHTIAVTCNRNSGLIPMCELAIVAEVGPEVINGSTRMKAGTAQKMILNMLSTAAMIRFGRVRGTETVLQEKAVRLADVLYAHNYCS